MTTLTDFARRSPLGRELAQSGACYTSLGDAAIAATVGEAHTDMPACAVIDLSPLPRVGVKGWRVWPALRACGLRTPSLNNTGVTLGGGGLCARLSDREALILPALDHTAQLPLDIGRLDLAEGAYPISRRDTHAWLALAGSDVSQILAKMCAVDFRLERFPDLSIAQTPVAEVAAILLRWDRCDAPVFHLLADSSNARYLWRACLDVGARRGSCPAGYNFLTSLGAQENSRR